MPVNTPHCKYEEMVPRWLRMRDVISGEDRVKEQATSYIPRLSGQSDTEYRAYVLRAQFFNATARTQDAFTGLMFRKPMAVTHGAKLDQFIKDATLTGSGFTEYAKSIAKKVLATGRAGTLVDWSDQEARPYLVAYEAEQIINWRKQRINGKMMLTMIVLKECVTLEEAQREAGGNTQQAVNTPETPQAPEGQVSHSKVTGTPLQVNEADGDEYTERFVHQIRVLCLDIATAPTGETTTKYCVEIYQEMERKAKSGALERAYEMVSEAVPLRVGQPLNEIPFVFHGPNNMEPEIDKPPMEDIALTNLSHYRSSADLEHGRHFTGLPTAYAAGFDDKKEMRIGSTVAWVTKEPGAKAAFLEFTGQGLKALETALSTKEHHMAVLGARMLEVEKKEAETAQALSMKQTGESSSLATIAGTLSAALSIILRYAEWWMGAADTALDTIEADVKVNTDFNINRMGPQEVTALTAAWLNRAISHATLLWNFRQGEILDPAKSIEDEMAIIDSEAPPAIAPQPGKPAAA